jgi:hypothetical protein
MAMLLCVYALLIASDVRASSVIVSQQFKPAL